MVAVQPGSPQQTPQPAPADWPEQAQPAEGSGHALWSLHRPTCLEGLWMGGMREEEKEEKKQAIRRLAPAAAHFVMQTCS